MTKRQEETLGFEQEYEMYDAECSRTHSCCLFAHSWSAAPPIGSSTTQQALPQCLRLWQNFNISDHNHFKKMYKCCITVGN